MNVLQDRKLNLLTLTCVYSTFLLFYLVFLAGGSEASPADITIKLTWTAQVGAYVSDLDLYVTEPNGEVASPTNRNTSLGGELDSGDSSPETYEMETGYGGDYTIEVRYPGYDTDNPQEATVTVNVSGVDQLNFGSQTLGQTVGATWYVGKFSYPGGDIVSDAADIIIKLIWTAESGVYASESDLDLYVTEPGGEQASPSNPYTGSGGEISDSEAGPEFYHIGEGEEGDYTIAVKYPGYDTDNPQEASVNVMIYGDTLLSFGPESLGRTVGSTWHVGTFDFPSGEVTSWGDTGGSSGCFIATAAYGSPVAHEVSCLRSFRDRYLSTNKPGRGFLTLYYRFSPPLARFIRNSHYTRKAVRSVLRVVISLWSRLKY